MRCGPSWAAASPTSTPRRTPSRSCTRSSPARPARAHRGRRHARASTPTCATAARAGPRCRNALRRSAFRHSGGRVCRAAQRPARPPRPGARPRPAARRLRARAGEAVAARAGTRCAWSWAIESPRTAQAPSPRGTTPAAAAQVSFHRAAIRAQGELPEVVLQVSRFPWGADPAGWLRVDRPRGRPARLRRHRPDGPPHPDPAGRPRLGADPGAVGDPGPARRARHRPAAGHPGLAGHLPSAGDHRENRCHP